MNIQKICRHETRCRQSFSDYRCSTFDTKSLLSGREVVEPNTMVSWRQFNRENLPTKTFTFWTWFFKVMELVSSQYVKKYWNEE